MIVIVCNQIKMKGKSTNSLVNLFVKNKKPAIILRLLQVLIKTI